MFSSWHRVSGSLQWTITFTSIRYLNIHHHIKNGNNSFISNISFMDPESKLDSKNLIYFRVNLETNVKFL